MGTYSGFNANTTERLLLDAGALFINFDVGTDTPETATSKLIGATSGGNTFSAIPTFRQPSIDGVRGRFKGGEILQSWEVTLNTNMLEISDKVIEYALASSNKTDATILGAAQSNYFKITANNQVALTDYVNNITWVGTISGSNNPVIIVIKNALSDGGFSLNPQDSADIVATLNFMGHYDSTDLDNPPFEIYYPKITVDTTPPTVTTNITDGATGTAVTTNFVWTFNEAIHPNTVNSANFMLIKTSDGSLVAGNLTHSADKTTVTFDPTTDLSATTAYIAIATTNVTDVAGNKLANQETTNFTTA